MDKNSSGILPSYLCYSFYWSYIVLNDPQLSELKVQKTQRMKGESPMIVEIPQSLEWYNNKWFLLGMECVCIFTIYGLSKGSTYGLWDSILLARLLLLLVYCIGSNFRFP